MYKHYLTIVLLCSFLACSGKKEPAGTPLHYNLNKPEKFVMPGDLYEISGIAFNSHNDDTIYAEQDEEGILFRFVQSTQTLLQTRFGKKGDYEDVAICNGYVIMLRSDGVLYTFPLLELGKDKAGNVQEWKGLLPAGEYEGLYADEVIGKVYVLCKHCSDEKTSKLGGGSIFSIDANGTLSPSGSFEFKVKQIEALAGQNKINFHPSALAKNKISNQWYILSSVNHMLVIADANWVVKEVYPLPQATFMQPEGIAFDSKNNLYISNEGGLGSGGNILKFTCQP